MAVAVRVARRQSSRRGAMLNENPNLRFLDSVDRTHEIPDIMEFTSSEEYLDRPNLYPRQATLLKIIFLQTELFTPFDHEVIAEWIASFTETEDNGIQPDIYERIAANRMCPCGHDRGEHGWLNHYGKCEAEGCACKKYLGRKWFRECVMVMGRRGSKGYIGSIAGAYVLWHYLMKSDPQEYYGVDRDKQLACFVFAAKKEQAVVNQWGDLNNVIIGAPCFTRYISRPLAESLSVFAPHDGIRLDDREARGIFSADDIASFTIEAKESTKTSGRGPAAMMLFFDEMAHAVKGVAKTDISDVYDAATPALDQFGVDAFIYEPSSPWQMIGRFYENYVRSLATDEDGVALDPQILMVQLTSWDIYEDWDRAYCLEVVPEEYHARRAAYAIHEKRDPEFAYSSKFKELSTPIQAYTEDLRREEEANPETFAVERRARFATVVDAYLNADRVDMMFQPFSIRLVRPDNSISEMYYELTQQSRGKLAILYKAHGDPSKSGKNFGWGIAHREGPDTEGFWHVIFDKLHHWEPRDFPDNNNEIDYILLGEFFKNEINLWMPEEMTFDQWNSVEGIQRLREHVRKAHLPKRVDVFERTASAPVNWAVAETFKTALGMGLVHAPPYEQASKELKFLQLVRPERVDHPTAGPVQTKDVADVIMILTAALIGDQVAAFVGQSLANLSLGGMAMGGIPKTSDERDETAEAFSRFSRRRGRAGVERQRPGARGLPTGSPARRRFRGY